jgi:alanine racemase
MGELDKRTWAEVSLENIRHNYAAIRAAIPAGCKFLGVVKANAYGHGALEVSRTLAECGADYLAVSCLDEAMELRDGGVTLPILILGHTPCEYTRMLIENNITQTITCLAKAQEFSAEAQRLGKELLVHIALDTGMSRLGVLCRDERFDGGVENIIKACRMPGLIPEGAFTHFAVSDEPGADNEAYTREQFRLFCEVLDEVEAKGGIKFRLRHCAYSGAVAKYPEMCLDMVRPGLLTYGVYPDDRTGGIGLTPVMTLKSRVAALTRHKKGDTISYGRTWTAERDCTLAVLPIGYADGLHRCLSGKLEVLLRGRRAPQVGRVCMDRCMVDVTDLPEVSVGDVAVVFGPGTEGEPTASELAEKAGTIPYELLCAVSPRVPRIYTR